MRWFVDTSHGAYVRSFFSSFFFSLFSPLYIKIFNWPLSKCRVRETDSWVIKMVAEPPARISRVNCRLATDNPINKCINRSTKSSQWRTGIKTRGSGWLRGFRKGGREGGREGGLVSLLHARGDINYFSPGKKRAALVEYTREIHHVYATSLLHLSAAEFRVGLRATFNIIYLSN